VKLVTLILTFLICAPLAINGQPQVKIDSLKMLLDLPHVDEKSKVQLLNQIGFEFWTVDPAQSEKYGLEAARLASQLHDTSQLAMAHRVIGVSHWSRGNAIEALQHLYKSQGYYKEKGDKPGNATTSMNIGLVLIDQKDYQQALSYFFDAKRLFEELQYEERIASALTNIGTVYLQSDRLEESEKYLTRALEIHKKQNYQFGIMEASNRLGLLALHKGNLGDASAFLNQSLQIARSNKDQEHIIKNLENLARVHIARSEYKRAESMLKEALPMARTKNYKKWLRDILHDYKLIHQSRREFDRALHYADQYEILNDSIFNEEKAAQIANLKMEQQAAEQKAALRLREQEIALLQQRKKINQLSTLLLTSILILFVIVAIIIFRTQRSGFNRRHAQVKKDLERARQIEEELKRTLHIKDKEITSYTMNFIRKNELLEELGEKIAHLKGKLPASSKELNSILNLVQNNSIDKDWDDFKKIFENVHQDFFGKLLRQYPDLSPNELKLCALVYMNLSIKEMASLMGISPDSVKTSRYRLRKKLGLTQDQNLSEFIINYG